MSIRCDICGKWSPGTGFGARDICAPCYRYNFAGAMPPLDLQAPLARAALEAYVDNAAQLTARQLAALRRMQAAEAYLDSSAPTPRQREIMRALAARWAEEVEGA